MTPGDFVATVLDPGLALLNRVGGIWSDDRARVLLVAIAGQESGITSRRQTIGPARGWFQFELSGTEGVLANSASAAGAATVCYELCIPTDGPTVYEAIAWSDSLSVAFARLLLWTDPPALPAIGSVDSAFDTYTRCWRPGRPSRSRWTSSYQNALAAIAVAPAPATVLSGASA